MATLSRPFEHEVLTGTATRIVNEVRGINRVVCRHRYVGLMSSANRRLRLSEGVYPGEAGADQAPRHCKIGS